MKSPRKYLIDVFAAHILAFSCDFDFQCRVYRQSMLFHSYLQRPRFDRRLPILQLYVEVVCQKDHVDYGCNLMLYIQICIDGIHAYLSEETFRELWIVDLSPKLIKFDLNFNLHFLSIINPKTSIHSSQINFSKFLAQREKFKRQVFHFKFKGNPIYFVFQCIVDIIDC